MANLFLNLLLVSAVTSIIILLLVISKKLFKNKYAIALKQFLWIVLALRLIVPLNYNHTLFSTSVTQYNDEDIITFSTKSLLEQDDETTTYISPFSENSRPKKITQPFDETYIKNNITTSQLLGKVIEFKENEKLMTNESIIAKNNTFQFKFLQFIHFIQKHINTIFFIYICGVALFLLINIILLIILHMKKHKYSIVIEEERINLRLIETAESLHLKRIPKLFWMRGITSPMAVGFFRYSILLPREDYTDKELNAIFTHELTHILHWDLRLKVIYLLANSIHWFNPIVYLMVQEACKDMELYCDYSVVEMMNKDDRIEYNELLLEILKGHKQKHMQSLLTTCFKGGVKEMKERFICNMDMRKKKSGVIPTCMTAIIIIISAGLFSLNVINIDVNADFEESFWFNHQLESESDWREIEDQLNEPYESLEENQQYFRAGDASLPLKPRLTDDNECQVPEHYNDANGGVYVTYHNLWEGKEIDTLSAPPEVEIYCNNSHIEHYGVTLNEGWSNASEISQNPDFFKEQAPKENENELFYVQTWMDMSGTFLMFFPEGQSPAFIDVQDTVLNDDGTVRYPNSAFEIIYRTSYIDDKSETAVFDLSNHYSIENYENWITYDELVHPYNRGYRVTCYWNTKQGLQSCTYYFVIRTQTTQYDEMLNEDSTNQGIDMIMY